LEFLLGVAVSFAPPWRLGIWGIPLGAILLAGAGLMGIAPTGGTMDFLLGHDGLQRVLIFGIPAALIVYGTLQFRARESVWTYLGDASYSLYLSHIYPLTILLALWMKFPIPPDLIILIGISAALLFAWRIHERIEKPILVALKRQQPNHRTEPIDA
jgi:exopolysaccharide production protein ExoZ